MDIIFKPYIHIEEGIHVLSGIHFKYNETKKIDDNETIRVKINGISTYVNLVEDLLSSPFYKDAETGLNPNFVCSKCNIETLAEAFSDPLTGEGKFFEIDGKRVCVPCYKKNKNTIIPK